MSSKCSRDGDLSGTFTVNDDARAARSRVPVRHRTADLGGQKSTSRWSAFALAALAVASCTNTAASKAPSAMTPDKGRSATDIFFGEPPRGEGHEQQCPNAWSYPEISADGTDTWAAAGCALCASSASDQSPIDILDANVSPSRGWPRPSGPSPASFSVALPAPPDQHDLNYAFKVGDGRTMSWSPIPTFTYQLDSFHFHVKSEHLLQGAQQDLELHVKATTTVGGKNFYAVFAMLFSRSAPPANAVSLAPVADAMQGTAGSFDLSTLLNLFTTGSSYTYTGTLTTPPCGPDRVQWFVLADVQYVDAASWQAIGTAISGLTGGPANVRLSQAWTPDRHLFQL